MKELDDGLKIYDITELEDLKELKCPMDKNQREGYLYILKYNAKDNIDTIKIGVTRNPFNRITKLAMITNSYGFSSIEKIAISKPHLNYYKSERCMHKYYEEKRKPNCEIFNISFEEACNNINNLLFIETKVNTLSYIPTQTFIKTPAIDNITIKKEIMIEIIKNCKHVSLLVYLSILCHYDKILGYSCMSYNEIVKEVSVSKTTISTHIKLLEKFGYIKIVSGGYNIKENQNTSNAYYILDNDLISKGDK